MNFMKARLLRKINVINNFDFLFIGKALFSAKKTFKIIFSF